MDDFEGMRGERETPRGAGFRGSFQNAAIVYASGTPETKVCLMLSFILGPPAGHEGGARIYRLPQKKCLTGLIGLLKNLVEYIINMAAVNFLADLLLVLENTLNGVLAVNMYANLLVGRGNNLMKELAVLLNVLVSYHLEFPQKKCQDHLLLIVLLTNLQ